MLRLGRTVGQFGREIESASPPPCRVRQSETKIKTETRRQTDREMTTSLHLFFGQRTEYFRGGQLPPRFPFPAVTTFYIKSTSLFKKENLNPTKLMIYLFFLSLCFCLYLFVCLYIYIYTLYIYEMYLKLSYYS